MMLIAALSFRSGALTPFLWSYFYFTSYNLLEVSVRFSIHSFLLGKLETKLLIAAGSDKIKVEYRVLD